MISAVFHFFSKNRFRKEMTIVILLKIIALFLLWELFFSHPVTPALTYSALTQHFIGDE